jgi:hypothetical protein
MEDWDRPLAAEVLARALAATGDGPGARAAWERARHLVEVVAEDGERRAVEELMETEPAWP